MWTVGCLGGEGGRWESVCVCVSGEVLHIQGWAITSFIKSGENDDISHDKGRLHQSSSFDGFMVYAICDHTPRLAEGPYQSLIPPFLVM